MAKKLVTRKEVPVELTWKLEDLYPTEEAMLADLDKALLAAKSIEETYHGKLNTAKAVAACLSDVQKAYEIIVLVENYAELAQSVDYQDQHLQELAGMVGLKSAQFRACLSFVEVEIGQCTNEVLEAAAKLHKQIQAAIPAVPWTQAFSPAHRIPSAQSFVHHNPSPNAAASVKAATG